MVLKLVMLAALAGAATPQPAPKAAQIADEEGDLNPQPLPPIAEEARLSIG